MGLRSGIGPSRRELLRALAGAPLLPGALGLLSGCRRRPALPEGELVGPNLAIGHDRLRAHSLPPRPAKSIPVAVAIVGGGVAGLGAAWRLRGAGIDDFVLLELESVPGGTARSGRSEITAYPWGAHYLPAPLADNRPLVRLFSELGLIEGHDDLGHPIVVEEALVRDPEERLFAAGRWNQGLYLHAGESAADRAQLARFLQEIDRWVAWRDGRGRRAFVLPSSSCADDPEVTALDRLSMAAWLDRQGLTSPRLRWLVDYACHDDYGLLAEKTSAWAGIFYFAARLAAPGRESRPLVAWPEGNGRLVRHLAAGLGERLRLGSAVLDLDPIVDERGAEAVELLALRGDHPVAYRAQAAIFAGPQFVARHVIGPYRREPPRHLAEFQYGAWLVANLHLTNRPVERGFPLAWDNVLRDSPALGYVTATHQAGIDHGPTVLTYYRPFTNDDPKRDRQALLEAGQPELAAAILADLRRAHPDISALTRRLDVMRWGHAMIRPTPGFVHGGARERAQKPLRRIHFAHSDLAGLALFEEALDQGVRAAEEVLAVLGRGGPSWR